MGDHTGTHMDALCHQACDLNLHGGIPSGAVETPAGFLEHSIDKAPPLVTRGVLLDLARSFGAERLPDHYSLSADELIHCAQFQNVSIEPGDALLVRTGAGAIWDQPSEYLRAAGVARSGSEWAANLGVVAVGADNMAWDPLNGERDPETGATLPGHLHLLVGRGIYILENLNLEELAVERIYEFGFIATPLKLTGATGSPIRPIAVI
jgi:kynurenine formamidase